MLLSIGSLLAAERERKGIPIEKAAKETRMRAQRLLDLENDDLSQFSSASYARMFIIAYAKYLGVPMEQVYKHLPERGSANAEAYNYITSSEHDLPSLRTDIAGRRSRPSKPLIIIATIVTLIILGGCGILGAYLWVNLPRRAEAGKNIGATPAPEPTPLKSAEEELGGTSPHATLATSEIFEESASLVTTPAPIAENLPEVGGGSLQELAPGNQTEAAGHPPAEATLEDRAFLMETSPASPATATPASTPTP